MEFQAIVMAAGKGSRITEAMSGLPKCLLPVGNVPLIKSCLNILKNFNVNSVLVVVLDAEKTKIQETLDLKGDSKVELVGIPVNDDWGTADSLRSIHDKIHSDVIIMSCDFVSTFNLLKLAIFHRKRDADLTVLLTPLSKTMKDAIVPGQKSKNKPEKDIIALEESGRIVLFNSEADFEEGVPMRMPILQHHPVFQVFSNLVDTHVYMMKKSLVDFIVSSKQISTIKGEFLPVIVSKQFSKKPLAMPSDAVVANSPESCHFKDFKSLALQLSSYDTQEGYRDSSPKNHLKCYAYVEREALCVRSNTLVGYMEINRQISRNMEATMGVSRKLSSFPKSQVDNDSILGDDVKLMAKSSIKQSTIGSNCSFNEKVKVSGSVVMDGVSIQAGTTIQGCIVCRNASIGSRCELKNCVVGLDQVVEDGTKLVNEIVQGTYQFMEV